MNIFTKHPTEVKMSYSQHLLFAIKFSGLFLFLAVASFVHAFFPFLFTNTASRLVEKIHRDFKRHKLSCCRQKKAASNLENKCHCKA